MRPERSNGKLIGYSISQSQLCQTCIVCVCIANCVDFDLRYKTISLCADSIVIIGAGRARVSTLIDCLTSIVKQCTTNYCFEFSFTFGAREYQTREWWTEMWKWTHTHGSGRACTTREARGGRKTRITSHTTRRDRKYEQVNTEHRMAEPKLSSLWHSKGGHFRQPKHFNPYSLAHAKFTQQLK